MDPKANYKVTRNSNLVARCVLLSDAIEFADFVVTARGGDVRVEDKYGVVHFAVALSTAR